MYVLLTLFSFVFACFFCNGHQQPYDVNIIGVIDDKISVSRHALSFIDSIKDDIKFRFLQTRVSNFKDLPTYLKNIAKSGLDLSDFIALKKIVQKGYSLKGITIFTDYPWEIYLRYFMVPNHSTIKMAYAVTERTEILPLQVQKFNSHFDALLVPDEWLVDVYKNSGVTIPIFVLPLILDVNLKNMLKKSGKKTTAKPFIFGMTGRFTPRKNHELLLRAFAQEFGNNPNVFLKLHGSLEEGFPKIQKLLKELALTNASVTKKHLSRDEYENFISSLDCYAFISKGEGFSITPREAMAAGIPCILSDNTAHKIICKTGLVRSVKSEIIEPAFFVPTKQYIGHDFNCDINDVRAALRDMYQNYQQYLDQTEQGREWVKQYLGTNLQQKYLNVVKPKKVILGNENSITDNYLMTNSRRLFKKYKTLCQKTNTMFKEA